MTEFFRTHPRTRWTALIVTALVLLVVLVLLLIDWNLLRPALARVIAERTGRPARISGDLKVHPWSLDPSAEVDGLTLGNPPWAQHPTLFSAQSITVSVSLPRLLRGQLVLPRLEVVKPVIDLERDAHGRASWEFASPAGAPHAANASSPKLPIIRRLIIADGDLRVEDAIRKLLLHGTLSAREEHGHATSGAADSAFALECSGTLNAKPFHASFRGGPLVNLEPDRPYHLESHVSASDITLDARLTFRRPFDFGSLRVGFSIAGRDLADVYYLTGLALPNTPPYRLAGDLQADGTLYRMNDLKGRLGSSDLEGSMEIETAGERPKLSAQLHSATLDFVDLAPTLGHPSTATAVPPASNAPARSRTAAAANSTPPADSGQPQPAAAPAASAHLFPDADLQLNRVRGMDADVTYRATAVVAPKLPMKQVNFHLLLNDGLLSIDPLAFTLDAGRFSGSVRIDARKDVPEDTLAMSIQGVDLGQFKSAKETTPLLQGSLVGRMQIHGYGASVHKLAATAQGGVSVALPRGDINNAVAELAGIDLLHGLGLLISKPEQQTEIRCGVADFKATGGVLNTSAVFVDTSNVVVTGRGDINLGTERLDLALQGRPKKLRLLRLRTPVTVTGTLLDPVVGVKASKLLEQAGVAAALGALLTPAGAALAFIDPGLAKNKDCAAVLAEAKADQAPPDASTSPAGAPTPTAASEPILDADGTPSAATPPPPGTPLPGVGASQPRHADPSRQSNQPPSQSPPTGG